MEKRIAALLFALLLSACGEEGSSSTTSTGARHHNGGCPSPLEGGGAPGTACLTFSDCKEFCCACSSVSKSFAGAACIDGKCAEQPVACQKAQENSSLVCQ